MLHQTIRDNDPHALQDLVSKLAPLPLETIKNEPVDAQLATLPQLAVQLDR